MPKSIKGEKCYTIGTANAHAIKTNAIRRGAAEKIGTHSKKRFIPSGSTKTVGA